MYFALAACSAAPDSVPATADDTPPSEVESTDSSTAPVDTGSGVGVTSTTVVASVSTTTTSVVAQSTTVTGPRAPVTTVANSSMITSTTAQASRPRLVVSVTTNIDSNGENIIVRGTGFDVTKGVYVAVCNQPQLIGRRCVGGVNIDGSSPQSIWISSNPPGYAAGLPQPYGDGGVFSVTLLAKAVSPNIDCTRESCGIVAFADHTRSSDRSQDVYVPVAFR